MNIHEYQAKELFKLYDIPVSTGSVAYSSNEIETAVNNVSGPTWVCLLYTSPSPRDVEESRMPSSA